MELNKIHKIKYDYECKKSLIYTNYFIIIKNDNKNIIIETLNNKKKTNTIAALELVKNTNEKCKNCKYFTICLKIKDIIVNDFYALPYAIDAMFNEMFKCDFNKKNKNSVKITNIKICKMRGN